jgi:hypothetical protein
MRNKGSCHSLVRILVGGLLNFCLLTLTIIALAETPLATNSQSNDSSTLTQASTPGRFIDITSKSHLAFVGQASHTSKNIFLRQWDQESPFSITTTTGF